MGFLVCDVTASPGVTTTASQCWCDFSTFSRMGFASSHAALGRLPDDLVHLELEPHAAQPGFQQPVHKLNGLSAAEDATCEAGEASVEVVFADDAGGPVPVAARRDHELDLVG